MYEPCDVDKPFKYNHLFDIPSKIFDDYISTGVLPFKSFGKIQRGWYTYIFLFYHNSTIFERSSLNLSKAFRRQTCVRNIEVPDWDRLARERQTKLFEIRLNDNRRWNACKNRFLKHLQAYLSINHNDFVDSLLKFISLPHQKKMLRQNAHKFLDLHGTIFDNLFMDNIKLKFKCPEWAKPGKYGRTIGDYSTEGSLLTHGLIDNMKEILFKEYESYSFLIFKCRTPSVEVLRNLFRKFYTSEKDLYVLNSDDGMLRVNCTDGVLYANLDISSCDISNGPSIFNFLKHWASVDPILYHFVSLAVRQCEQCLKIINPENKREKLYFYPIQPIEFSGSTLTTILNDTAMFLVALYFSYIKKNRVLSKVETKKLFLDCVESSGYIFSFEEVSFEKLQFFKNSPVVIDGEIYNCLNLGVILRCLGHTKGDFLGRGDISYRGMLHSASVVLGMQHSGNSVVLRALLRRFQQYNASAVITDHVISGYAPEDLGYYPFLQRYDATCAEVDELIEFINNLQPGMVINSQFLERVFSVDYGISP